MNAQVETARFTPSATAPRAVASQTLTLTPAQQAAYDKLETVLSVSPVCAFVGAQGTGRTSIARTLAAKYHGRVISLTDVVEAVSSHPADSFEEAFDTLVMNAFNYVDLVVIDDYIPVMSASAGSYMRGGVIPRMVGRHLCAAATKMGKRLLFIGRPLQSWESPADAYGDQSAIVTMPIFTLVDYQSFADRILGKEKAAGIDMRVVYKYASFLNGYQLGVAFGLLAATSQKSFSADDVIKCLEDFVVTTNTRTAEVEALSFDSLPGAEGIVKELETNIVLPLENRELAQKMGLRPKRGVLLYGPPGTGKTSIGRALAHRMKGKFFIIDGSFVSEPPGAFFGKIQKVVQEAKDNSPSVLFIDDADVLFKIDHISGLIRYLLSLLDGLESETANGVCVMMTAMNVRLIPEALLRSGRVELWLETKTPSLEVRGEILERWMGTELPEHEKIDYQTLAELTDGFTPADLRRIAGDAKSLYAADIVAGREPSVATDYVRRAVEDIIAVRDSMAETLGDDTLRVGRRIKAKYLGNTNAEECGW